MNMVEKAKELGFKIRFISHERIKEYIACYRVVYKGKEIYPPAALKLHIPLNEIWISDAYKNFANYILFHEIREIHHRWEGYDVDEAHRLALKDEENEFKNDKVWERMKKEINICTFEDLISTPKIGKTLAIRIMENRPYNTIEDLLKIKGIEKKRFSYLKEKFWCIGKR